MFSLQKLLMFSSMKDSRNTKLIVFVRIFLVSTVYINFMLAEWIIRNLIFSICLALNPPFILNVNAAGESFGIEGETVTLNCSNDDNPNLSEQFSWLDSEGGALDSPGIVRPHNLVLANVRRSQSGVYVCVVSAGGGLSRSVNTTLIVQCKCTPSKPYY